MKVIITFLSWSRPSWYNFRLFLRKLCEIFIYSKDSRIFLPDIKTSTMKIIVNFYTKYTQDILEYCSPFAKFKVFSEILIPIMGILEFQEYQHSCNKETIDQFIFIFSLKGNCRRFNSVIYEEAKIELLNGKPLVFPAENFK